MPHFEPLKLEIKTPDGMTHKAEFRREMDGHTEMYGHFDGETRVVVAPSLLDQKWLNPSYSNDEEPFYSDSTYLSEWITSAIIEGWSDGEEDNDNGVSFKVLNPEKRGLEQAIPYTIFGEMDKVQDFMDNDLGLSNLDIIITNNSEVAALIKEYHPSLPSRDVSIDEFSDEAIKKINNQKPTPLILRAAIIEQSIIHGYEPDTPQSEILLENVASIPYLKSESKSKIVNALESEPTIRKALAAINKAKIPEILNKVALLKVNSFVESSREVPINQVLNELPLTDPYSRLVKKAVKLDLPGGDVDAFSYQEVRDYLLCDNPGKTLLAVTVENENTATIYESDMLSKLIKKPDSPKSKPDLEQAPESNLSRKM